MGKYPHMPEFAYTDFCSIMNTNEKRGRAIYKMGTELSVKNASENKQ